ncbi:MAG TPA: hypothetical protein VKR52_18855 [Terracidiphilus sp.]|nr:hypothetical protein [Terracidiphilus sp.]
MGLRAVRRRLWRFLAAVFLVGVWQWTGGFAEAQSFDATHIKQPVDLDATWLVHGGDDPAFASPQLDDSHWLRFDPRTSVDSVLKSRPAVVWYRLHMKVDPSQKGLALNEMNISRAFVLYVRRSVSRSRAVRMIFPLASATKLDPP